MDGLGLEENTHCNTLQITATFPYAPRDIWAECSLEQNTLCNTLQITATPCNSLQLTATIQNSHVPQDIRAECSLEHNTQNNRRNAAEDEQNLSCTLFACM